MQEQQRVSGDNLPERAPTAPVRPMLQPVRLQPERSESVPTAKRKLGVREAATAAVIGIAAIGGGIFAQYWWTTGRYVVSSDDAYVGAKNSTLSPKVAGYISAIDVDDNARVKAGDVIARIDNGDYVLAVQNVHDQIAIQQATIDRLIKQTAAQVPAVEAASAQVASAKAGLTQAELALKREQQLAAQQISSRQTLEQSQAAYDQAIASVRAAEANVQSTSANVDVLNAQQEEARRTLQQLETSLAKAERDLSFTIVRAPFDGVVGNRAVQVGDYVQPSQRLASLVPLNSIYIDANFKETQLSRLMPGQPVTIAVDALPDHKIEGRVESLAPASGSVFSLLPPDNATGNFTKIVQRLPVRILVPAEVAEQSLLRPGMSVTVSVNTKPGAPVSAVRMSSATMRAVD